MHRLNEIHHPKKDDDEAHAAQTHHAHPAGTTFGARSVYQVCVALAAEAVVHVGQVAAQKS
jgi:hypothetical protein